MLVGCDRRHFGTHFVPLTKRGLLLFGLKPIPERYSLGMRVPFTLPFLDQFEEMIEVESELVVIREKKRNTGHARPSDNMRETAVGQEVKRGSLFEPADTARQ